MSNVQETTFGTLPNNPDTDGDGLTDGEELRHLENGVLVGGWNITEVNDFNPTTYSGIELISASSSVEALAPGEGYWVSSDPLMPDDDGDTLNATEEMLNGLSPQARNALVPLLQMRVTPVGEIPDARPGAFWLPGTDVSINIELINIAVAPVTTTLTLTLPHWFDTISGGSLQGDRTPSMVLNGNIMSWDFSGNNALQLYEAVSTTVTARVNPAALSGYDDIELDLLYGVVQMHKAVLATVDGDNPVLSMIAPSNGAYLNGTSYVVGGTTVDRTTWITERSLSIVSQGSTPEFQTLPLGQGPWAYTWTLPTTDGIYTLQSRATDAMNHSATSSQVNVTVDNTPPTITLNWQMLDNTVKLSGLANDNQAGVECAEEGKDQGRERFEFFAEIVWGKDKHASHKCRDKTRHEICAFGDEEQDAGEEDVGGLRSEQGIFALCNAKRLQREFSFGICERVCPELDETETEGNEKSQPVQPAFVFESGGGHGGYFTCNYSVIATDGKQFQRGNSEIASLLLAMTG